MTIESNPVTEGVRRFDEIEGLRGWLSWTVVGWHLIQYTGLNARYRILGSTAGLAHLAVEVFIIISGFVVTHLLTTRPESYLRYLTRRAFRLFPVYLLCAAAGAITTGLAAQAVTEVAWTHDPGFAYRGALLATYASQIAYFPIHAILHLLLFQGAVPDSLLPFSSAVFIGPAWSLSLEWQFYLIAPIVVGALASRRFAPLMAAAMIGGFLLYRLGWLGAYRLESIFPAAALLFLTGIASRLWLDRLTAMMRAPVLVALAGLALAVAAPEFFAIGLWVAFYAFLVTTGWPHPSPAARLVGTGWSTLFGSRIARWFGGRSYGVYLVHWPVLQLTLYLLRYRLSANTGLAALTLALIIIPITLVAAELLHHGVERPMIRLGSRVAGRKRSDRLSAVAALGGAPS